jgi:hypothetical protein
LIHRYLIRNAGASGSVARSEGNYAPAVQRVTDSAESLKTVSDRARSPQQYNLTDPHK